jgi:hypothetical protein
MKMKKLFLLALLFGAVSFAFAQDTDNDGTPDANDCAPTDPSKWASVIFINQDGDAYPVMVTGCWGTPFSWNNATYFYTDINSFSCFDSDDLDMETGCLAIEDGGNTGIVASGDADNDGEPDFTDPYPLDPVYNHMNMPVNNGCVSVYAGTDETLYFGYSLDQCVSKTAVITNGMPPFTYSWTLDRVLLENVVNSSGDETMTGANTPIVTVCLLDTAQLCVTVTDANNCTYTDCATIFASDARCFSGNSNIQKVQVCHQGHSICVDQSAVNAHLGHGDNAGACTGSRIEATTGVHAMPEVEVFPNPASDKITIKFNSCIGCNYSLMIFDATGRTVVERIGVSLVNANTMELDLSFLSKGIYSLRFSSDEVTQQRKIVKQ